MVAERIVVIFEGRDSAGKGGAIKRITQRLNPRVCRVKRLYLHQRNVSNHNGIFNVTWRTYLPLVKSVLFDRSWYNRVGVRARYGFLVRMRSMRSFFSRCSSLSA